MSCTRTNRERGMVLLTVTLVTLMLAGLSAGLLFEGVGERVSVEQRRTTLMALELCELAAVRAQLEIFAMKDSGSDGIGVVSGAFAGGWYETTAAQTPGYPDRWTVKMMATHRLSRKCIEVGIRRREHSDWVEGLYAKDEMRLNGDLKTDGYDSRLGTYASQAVNSDGGGPYAEGGGHVGSNGDIRVTGTAAHIRGNAIPGPLSDVLQSGSPTIWGDVLPRKRAIPLYDTPLSEFAAAMNVNDNANHNVVHNTGQPPYKATNMSLTLVGSDVVELPGGTYFFSSVKLSGGAELRVTGPSTIYVTDSFSAGGGVLTNSTGVAGNLRVYAHPYPLPGPTAAANPAVSFNGGAATALAVWAPGVDISVGGNADVYGAVVGKEIAVTGDAYFHYDKALGVWDKHTTVTIERLYWRDLDTRLR